MPSRWFTLIEFDFDLMDHPIMHSYEYSKLPAQLPEYQNEFGQNIEVI